MRGFEVPAQAKENVSRVDVPRALAALVDANAPVDGASRPASPSSPSQRFTMDVWRALLVSFLIPYAGFLLALIIIPTPGGAFGAQIGVCATLTLHGLLELLLFLLYPTSAYGLHLFLGCGALALAAVVWVRVVLTLLMPTLFGNARREGMVKLDGEDVLADNCKARRANLRRGVDSDIEKLAALV